MHNAEYSERLGLVLLKRNIILPSIFLMKINFSAPFTNITIYFNTWQRRSFQTWGLYKPSSSWAMKKQIIFIFRNLKPSLPYDVTKSGVRYEAEGRGGGGRELAARPLKLKNCIIIICSTYLTSWDKLTDKIM